MPAPLGSGRKARYRPWATRWLRAGFWPNPGIGTRGTGTARRCSQPPASSRPAGSLHYVSSILYSGKRSSLKASLSPALARPAVDEIEAVSCRALCRCAGELAWGATRSTKERREDGDCGRDVQEQLPVQSCVLASPRFSEELLFANGSPPYGDGVASKSMPELAEGLRKYLSHFELPGSLCGSAPCPRVGV